MRRSQHPRRDELFRSERLGRSLRQWLRQAKHAAEQLSEQSLQMDGDEWAAHLVARFAIEPLVLHEDQAHIETAGSRKPTVLVVPFTGNPDLFEQDPSPAHTQRAGASQDWYSRRP